MSSISLTRTLALALAAGIVLFAGVASAETRLLRFPDVHGDRVVFTHGGDLWSAPATGGTATRLTSHSGLELFAKFSPDGESIAFTGQYGGDEQVFVMPSGGGEPQQLTWYPARGPLPPRWGYDNQVFGWTPDGDAVLFRSLRDAWGSSVGRLYTVGLDGRLPETLPMPASGAGTFAEDGDRVFYSPLFRDFRTWKRYEGGWAQDLWMFDMASGEAEQITSHRRSDRDPMWIDGRGYFASDRGEHGRLNLYRWDPESGETTQLTFHDQWDVRWPSAGDDGRIVYELNGALRIYDTGSDADRVLEIHVPDDGINRRVRMVKVGDSINGAALSPTGKRLAFSARGDLFNVPADKGVTRNLTRRSSAHDREPAWSPDGQSVAFISDVSGEEELYVMPADGSSEPRALTEGNQRRFYQPRFSPDGERIAISDHEGRIYVVDADGGDLREVARDEFWRNRDYTWSPAGDLLAFSLTEESGLRALHLFDAESGDTHRLTPGLFSEYNPVFSPDGKHLYFLGDREFSPQISGREWNFATNRVTGIYAFRLTEDAEDPFAPEDAADDGILESGDNGDNGDNGESDDNGKDRPERTELDLDGITDRVVRVPVDASNYAALFVTGDALMVAEYDAFYYGRSPERQPRLKKYKIADREWVDFAADIQGADYSADGKHVAIRKNGGWQVLEIAKDGKEPQGVETGRMVAEVDPAAEWETAFDEVWRRFRDHFYVENMHGYDWEAIGEQYRPWLEHVGHRADLNYVLGEMISELNVSHAYVSGGDMGLPDRPSVALLGARFELDEDTGRFRISDILDGQNDEERYRSPLTEHGVEVAEGDYLLAINGHSLTGDDNPFRHLAELGGQPVELTVSDDADGDDSRTVLVNPISDEQPLYYLRFVTDNHRKVTEATDGRVGYLHIPDMGPDGIREFVKWYYGQIRKEGLVIDVRSNGGGNVSQMLIERLARKPLSLGYSRTMPNPTTYPYQAFAGHLVALLDENSASDGDIFPWQFRNAGLGPLIGKRSWGGVVGITFHGPLIDGGSVNVPEFGFADIEGEYVIEGEGVVPDIEVENDPASVIAGRDPQLQRGIEEVMRRIDEDPPELPERPEDPVKTP